MDKVRVKVGLRFLLIIPCSQYANINLNPSLNPNPNPNPNQRSICHALTLMDWKFKGLIRFRAWIKIHIPVLNYYQIFALIHFRLATPSTYPFVRYAVSLCQSSIDCSSAYIEVIVRSPTTGSDERCLGRWYTYIVSCLENYLWIYVFDFSRNPKSSSSLTMVSCCLNS